MKSFLTILFSLALIGETMALTLKETSLVKVASETARGDLVKLELAYKEALEAGVSTQELKEVATQAYAYCGFPKSLNSLATLMKVAPEKEGGVNPSRPDGDSLTRGEKAVKILPGSVVEIPANVEHWHGAAPNSWFSHLAVETNPKTNKNTWLEPVSDADYMEATK